MQFLLVSTLFVACFSSRCCLLRVLNIKRQSRYEAGARRYFGVHDQEPREKQHFAEREDDPDRFGPVGSRQGVLGRRGRGRQLQKDNAEWNVAVQPSISIMSGMPFSLLQFKLAGHHQRALSLFALQCVAALAGGRVKYARSTTVYSESAAPYPEYEASE